MKKLLVTALLLAFVASIPAFAAGPPYNIPPGQYCKKFPKTKLPGHKKTQFAECTSAMTKLDKKSSLAPSQACAAFKTAKGTAGKKAAQKAFKACIAAGKKLKLDKANA